MYIRVHPRKRPSSGSYNRAVGFSYLRYAKGIFRPLQLEGLFLFVTSTCNSLCRTCFYWEELNQGRDLSFDQLARVSQTAPKFHKLWISGGEPFLRKELADVAFSVKAGERSPIVETPDACYLMLVEEKRPAHVKPLGEVREQIERDLLSEERKRLEKQWTERLKKKTFVTYFE